MTSHLTRLCVNPAANVNLLSTSSDKGQSTFSIAFIVNVWVKTSHFSRYYENFIVHYPLKLLTAESGRIRESAHYS